MIARTKVLHNFMPIKERILLSAAHHFADHGFEGTTLRDVMRNAGVYMRVRRFHAGLKPSLYRAAVMRYLEPICVQRLEALAHIDPALPTAHRVRALIRAYVTPHLNLCTDPAAQYYLRLVARFGTEPRHVVSEIFAEFIDPVREQYLRAFGEALAVRAMDDKLIRAFGYTVLLKMGAPCNVFYESMTSRYGMPIKPATLIDNVVAMGAAGFLKIPATLQTKKRGRRTTGTIVAFPTSVARSRVGVSG